MYLSCVKISSYDRSLNQSPKNFHAFTKKKKIYLSLSFLNFFFSLFFFSFFFFCIFPFFSFHFFSSFFSFFSFTFSPLMLSCLQNLVPAYKRRLQDCGYSAGLPRYSAPSFNIVPPIKHTSFGPKKCFHDYLYVSNQGVR